MAFLETVEVLHQAAKHPRQVRISRNVKRACEFMVLECQKRPEAAQNAGITDDAMRKAMLKPEVSAYINTLQGVCRTSAVARTIAKAEQLMDAKSESVQLDAVKYLNPPVQRSENVHIHQGSIPGLTIILAAQSVPEPDGLLITHQRVESGKYIEGKVLGDDVPHPAMRNATESAIATPAGPSNRKARRATPGGAK